MAAKKPPPTKQIGMVLTPEEFERLRIKTGQKPGRMLYPKQVVAITRTENIIGVGGGKFGGKGQPLHSKILTPFGWKQMGELKVGSLVSNPTGGTAYVIGIFPLGEREIFRVTFSDGASTLVTEDHLWLARLSGRLIKADRRYFPFADEDRIDAKVYTTKWLKEYIDKERINHPTRDQNGNGASAVLVPLTEPVEYSPGSRAQTQTIDPYVLGVLLGDGCLRNNQVRVSSNDASIIDLIRVRTGLELSHIDGCDWTIKGAKALRGELEKLGVYGCLSHQKFIPFCYKWAAVRDRWELVQGLMDTDGYADARGHCSFTSVSEKLADDMREVLWSLGFKVTKTCGPAGYKNGGGDYVACRDAYTLYIQGARMAHLFKLERKVQRVLSNRSVHAASSLRRMVSIEPVGKEQAQCIQVDHPNNLYITDDCVVTHNTHGGIYWMISGNKHAAGCGAHDSDLIPICKSCGNPFESFLADPDGKRVYRPCVRCKTKEYEMLWVPRDCTCGFPDYDKDGNRLLVNQSYTNHPKFLGVVIRENTVDLRDWIREAKAVFGLLGGEFKEGDKEFHFPTGATVFCGHYQDEDSFTKYAGLNITRFLVEEATHIPNVRKRIQMLRSCCRSVYPEMRAQMMLTFNPGGVSHGDILDMFVEPKDADGNIIPPETTITEEYNADEIYARLGVPKPPEVGEKIISTRVFVFSKLSDNPSALANQDYIAALMEMPEEEREAYLFGNWRILAGEFFRQFRAAGPLKGEPPEANHVVPFNIAVQRIQPWWWRTMACDWGYGHECATGWGCHDQDRDQFWITDEMVVSQTEPDVVGEEIARRTKPILKQLERPMIVMGLSHDAYGLRQDDRSIAELMAKGIGRILGPNMVHLPDLAIDRLKDQMEQQGQSTATAEADAIFANIRSQQKMGITIRRMRDSRVVGWQLIRSLMRWKSSLPEIKDIFDPNLASDIAYQKGLEAYGAYVKVFQQKREILPKMQIVGPPGACPQCGGEHFDEKASHLLLCKRCKAEIPLWALKIVQGTGLGCSRLINAIPKAIRDPNNPEDVVKKHVEGASDLWDMLRYIGLTFRGQSMPEPFEALRRRKIAEALERHPNYDTADLVHVNRRLESAWKDRNVAKMQPIHILRTGRMARARVKGLITGPS